MTDIDTRLGEILEKLFWNGVHFANGQTAHDWITKKQAAQAIQDIITEERIRAKIAELKLNRPDVAFGCKKCDELYKWQEQRLANIQGKDDVRE